MIIIRLFVNSLCVLFASLDCKHFMNENDKEFFIPLNDPTTDRIRMRFKKVGGDVKDTVVQYESIIDNKWEAIVRFDWSHGFFHRDELFPDGSQRKTEFDLTPREGLNYAKVDLIDKWEFYKFRFLQKKKK